MEVSRSEADPVVKQRLFETGIVADAFLRLQVRVGEKEELREADEKLTQRRRLEAGTIACLELGLRNRNDGSRRQAKGRMRAEPVVVVLPDILDQEQAVGELRLQLDVAGLVDVFS